MDILRNGIGAWTGLFGSGWELVAGSCNCGNEPSGSLKMRGIASLVEDLLDSMLLVSWLFGCLLSLLDRITDSREIGP
jgi:hypothetical protein